MEDVQMIPLAAYESQGASLRRIIKWLIMGWAISMVAMGLVLVISISYTEEVVTETTTSEIMQDADNYGSNVYAGGDYYDSQANGDDDANGNDPNDETGSSVADTE